MEGNGRREESLVSGLEAKLLHKLTIVFDLYKEGRTVVTVTGLKDAYAVFGSSVLTLVFDHEVLNFVGGEEVADNHFSLTFAIGVAFFRESDVYA